MERPHTGEEHPLINMPNLIVMPGIGANSETLADKVIEILKEEFHLDNRAFMFRPLPETQIKGVERDSYRGFSQGFFKDHDPKAECGELRLRRAVDNNYVALVGYMEDPSSGHSINDSLMYLRAIGSLLGNVSPARKVLAVPYAPFLRSHSVKKYKRKGFLQADTLSIFLHELKEIGIDRIIAIEPHSTKFMSDADNLGIPVATYSPFSNPEAINFLKLGFKDEKEAEKVLRNLCAFTYLVRETFQDACLVSGDDNAETMAEQFAHNTGLSYRTLAAFEKSRLGEGESKIGDLKPWCALKPGDLKGKTTIIADDMISGGGTVNDIAKELKEKYKAGKVIVMVAHPVCPEPEKIEKLDSIDEIYCLATVPQKIAKLTIVPDAPDAHAYMLAVGLYKSYMSHIQRMAREYQQRRMA